jgi:hypothetical protein
MDKPLKVSTVGRPLFLPGARVSHQTSMKGRYSAASTRFLRFEAEPRASTGLRNCPV